MGRELSTPACPERPVRRVSPGRRCDRRPRPVQGSPFSSTLQTANLPTCKRVFLSIPCLFNVFRTLFRHGHSATPFKSIRYELFLSPRRVYPSISKTRMKNDSTNDRTQLYQRNS